MKIDFKKDFIEHKGLKFYVDNHRIGLDIDEVLADFIGGYRHRFGYCEINSWYFSYNTMANLEILKNDKNFWLSLDALISPLDLPFIPTCYISKRNFDSKITEEWLERKGFPCVPVIHVESDKVAACKAMELDYYVDDSIINFQHLNAAGIKTFLYNSIHNQQYDVGIYRIKSLKELIEKI